MTAAAPQLPCAAQNNISAARLCQLADRENDNISTRGAALKHINQALNSEPENAVYLLTKALILVKMEESEEALPVIEKSISIDPKSAVAWRTKAQIFSTLHDHKKAIAAITEAVRLENSQLNKLTQCLILASASRFDQAESELDQLVKLAPNDKLIRVRRAIVASHTKHWNKVIEDDTFLINHDDPRERAYCDHLGQRADAYVKSKNYERAAADYKTGIKKSPDSRQFHAGLLAIYKITGNTQGAQAESKIINTLDDDIQPFKMP